MLPLWKRNKATVVAGCADRNAGLFTIRRTALEIVAGNLSRRIHLPGKNDEAARMSADIKHMIDHIEQPTDGLRRVSNMLAHNIQILLDRMWSHLHEDARAHANADMLLKAATFAIGKMDRQIVLLDKLLQIAETELGTRRQTFETMALREVVTDIVAHYDAAAETKGIGLASSIEANPLILGHRELIAGALVNLLDNAFKYAGDAAIVGVNVVQDRDNVMMLVHDNGPGIPLPERSQLLQWLNKPDQRRQYCGLGLLIVAVVARLHGATMQLADAHPGLLVCIAFPRHRIGSTPIGGALVNDAAEKGETAKP